MRTNNENLVQYLWKLSLQVIFSSLTWYQAMHLCYFKSFLWLELSLHYAEVYHM